MADLSGQVESLRKDGRKMTEDVTGPEPKRGGCS